MERKAQAAKAAQASQSKPEQPKQPMQGKAKQSSQKKTPTASNKQAAAAQIFPKLLKNAPIP